VTWWREEYNKFISMAEEDRKTQGKLIEWVKKRMTA
jgi:hypothetical protein